MTARAIEQSNWITIAPDAPNGRLIEAWDLGMGESAVLALALATPGTEVIIDDLAGRRCASSLGIPVRGTLGIVLAARHRGIIPAARPVVEQLVESGMYLSRSVIDSALNLVGE